MVAETMQDVFTRGWEVDKGFIDSLVSSLKARMEEIEEEVVPTLPKIVKGAKKATQKFRKKDGTYYAHIAKYFTADYILDEVIDGQFTKVEFEDTSLRSVAQVKDYLLSQGWVPTEWNYKKDHNGRPVRGNDGRWVHTSPKITEDSLASIEHLGGTVKLVTEYLKCSHRLSVLTNPKGNGWRDRLEQSSTGLYKLRYSAITNATPTARMAHRILANVPNEDSFLGKELRQVFIAPDGYKVVGCDAKGCQMRMLAHHIKWISGGESEYVKSILYGTKENDDDVHCKARDSTEGLLTMRSEGKTLNYAMLFGQQDPALARSLGTTKKRAEKIRAKFFSNVPELPQILEELRKFWVKSHYDKRHRYIIGLDGRKIFCNAEHKLLNYLLQSDEAIFMKYAYCILWNWIQKEQLDAEFVLFYHDEFQLVVREDHAQRVAELSGKAMVKAGKQLGILVPTEGDPAIGNNWGETH